MSTSRVPLSNRTINSMIEILPCPYCASRYISLSRGPFALLCCTCGCRSPAYEKSREEAIEAWNRVSAAVDNQRRLTATLEGQA
jgi:hypothetical protein